MKRVILIIVVSVLSILGCSREKLSEEQVRDSRIEMYTKVISDYLYEQNLSDLQSVERWENDYGPGLKLITEHYEIFTTFIEPEILAKIPPFMESAYQAYNSQLPESIEISDRFNIYLFETRRQWELFTMANTGQQAQYFFQIQAGAYYYNGMCVAYNIGREKTFFALGHEGWHQFNGSVFKYRLPSWLDEGVAMLFESHATSNGRMYFDPSGNQYRIQTLKETLGTDSYIRLKELIAINPGQVMATDQTENTKAFYSQVYALVRFLREGDLGKRRNIYSKLLADGLYGNWPIDLASREIAIDRNQPKTILWNHIVGTQIFEQYIGSDYQQIEQEYLAFCRQLVLY